MLTLNVFDRTSEPRDHKIESDPFASPDNFYSDIEN